MSADQRFMAEALRLADEARGRSAPNPNVGCVVVSRERIVGRGGTAAGGRPHAEAIALAQAKVVVIAPSKGSEHFAQKGGTIRVTFASHSSQRYSPNSTDAEQMVQDGG